MSKFYCFFERFTGFEFRSVKLGNGYSLRRVTGVNANTRGAMADAELAEAGNVNLVAAVKLFVNH